MGEAKRRGSSQERINKARRRNEAIQNRIATFSRQVGEFGKKTGLDMGAVKLDARFVILKFDDLVAFIERLPISEAEIQEEWKQRDNEVPEEAPKVPWYRRLWGKMPFARKEKQ